MDLFQFAAVSKGLDTWEKLKLILFAAGTKPNTYLILKINPDSLEEKYQFEKILKKNNIIFQASRPKSYEEIKQIKGNKIEWQLAGTWTGYDLFRDEKSKTKFQKYVDLLMQFKHKKADKIAGELYGYPKCCVRQFIREHDSDYLSSHYSYYEYYKKIHDTERKYPWVFHQPHAVTCEATKKLNRIYEKVVKENKKKVWEEYDKKQLHKTDLIVSGMSDIIINGVSVWPEKDGYEYELVAKKPFNGKYYLISYLTKKLYAPGQVLSGEVSFRHNYADVVVKKEKQIIKGLHHERHLPLLGRKF